MARKHQRAKTFAQFLRAPTWSETDAARRGEHAVRSGGVNPAGEFFDPFGKQVVRQKAEISPEDAQRAVDAGALVVAEGCGCGGGPGGCSPRMAGRPGSERTARRACAHFHPEIRLANMARVVGQ